MMLDSMEKLEGPLKRMRAIDGWEDLVPTDEQFNLLLHQMLPILTDAKTLSDKLSTDKDVTCHKMLILLNGFMHKVRNTLRIERDREESKEFSKFLTDLLQNS